MKKPTLTPADQDYLKTIYDLSSQSQPVSTNAVAERLQVKPSSVTQMIQKLANAQPPLVSHTPRHGFVLTEAGQMTALGILRRHRLLEAFLADVLGFAWDEIHPEADRLEHVVSEKFIEQLDHLLGHPSFDPHGDPIPNPALHLPGQSSMPFSQLSAGDSAIIRRVRSQDERVFQRLGELHLTPGVLVRVTAVLPLDGVAHLEIGSERVAVVLGENLFSCLEVEVLPGIA